MSRRFQIKIVGRLLTVVALAGALAAFSVGKPAGAAQDGFGPDLNDGWHSPSLIEGRSVATSTSR